VIDIGSEISSATNGRELLAGTTSTVIDYLISHDDLQRLEAEGGHDEAFDCAGVEEG
jgi:hypothetical protein